MKGTLEMRFHSSRFDEVHSVPVVVDLVDSNLEPVQEPRAVLVEESPKFQLEAGIYGVHVSIPAGGTLRRSVTVKERDTVTADFDLHALSGHETLERTALLKASVDPGSRGLDSTECESAWLRLWRRDGGGDWRLAPFEPVDAWQSGDGARYEFSLHRAGYLLQLGGVHIPWRFVALPAHERVTVAVLPGLQKPEEVRVTAATGNDPAEALLGYLRTGRIEEGDQIVRRAEDLLFGKLEDPIAAAIAGYFLLRAGELEALRRWGPNLARFFEWLPDGAVVDGWQRIHAARVADTDELYDAGREQFLLAASRGVPIYTEGLRLLIDGLMLFASDDAECAAALQALSAYADTVDWSEATVTFRGERPDRPSLRGRTGMPASPAGMVFIRNIKLADLVTVGLLEPNTTLELTTPHPPLSAVVTERGTLQLKTGQVYADPVQAASAGLGGAPVNEWFGWGTWYLPYQKTTLSSLATEAMQRSPRLALDNSINRLRLSARTANLLRGAGYRRVGDVLRDFDDLPSIPGIGPVTLDEIDSAFRAGSVDPES